MVNFINVFIILSLPQNYHHYHIQFELETNCVCDQNIGNILDGTLFSLYKSSSRVEIMLHANGHPSATLNVPSDPLGL